jgi:ribosomal protein S27E
MIAEKAFFFGGGGICAIALGTVLYAYKGDGMLLGLIYILWAIGAVSTGLAIYSLFGIRAVQNHDVDCPYCSQKNVLTESPKEDFTCEHCSLLIPVKDGKVLPVFQVRCGFCNHLVYYNEKSEALICDNCDREIPIHTTGESHRSLPKSFTIHDDPNVYELILVDSGPKTEEMIDVLQKMLALNRSQVKQIMTETPITLLTGITIKKAEMLQTQLAVHEAVAEFKPVEPAAS